MAEGEAATLVGGGVQHPERGLESGGQQSARALGQQDRVGVGEGGVGQVLGWAATASVEGDLRWDQSGQAAEVGCRGGALQPHEFVDVCGRPSAPSTMRRFLL